MVEGEGGTCGEGGTYGKGGGLLRATAIEFLTSKITTVCGTKRQLYNILLMRKLFNEQLLTNLEQTLSRTSTTKILDRTF